MCCFTLEICNKSLDLVLNLVIITHMEKIDSFKGEYRWLSNFHLCAIPYDDFTYSSTEAAYQAAKCLNSKDKLKFFPLSPSESKKLGRKILIREDWEQIKGHVMEEVVRIKFTLHPDLKQKLLDTGEKELIEGNTWHDNCFGNCICSKCKDVVGENALGKILMKIREELKGVKI